MLAEPVAAAGDVPPFANSAMDGYAARSADIRAASPDRPARLRLTGEIRAGFPAPHPVDPRTALRIMTGAPIPDGADCVVRLEDTREIEGDVLVQAALPAGTSLRPAGSDMRRGTVIASEGRVITPGLIGVLASAGRRSVRCIRRPRVLLLTTGDELRDAGDTLGPGQITNSNRYALRAAIEEVGGLVQDAGVAGDDRTDLRRHLAGSESADLILTTGGVSMGAYDLVRGLLEEEEAIDFWQVAIRPGRPLAFGELNGVPLIGLPGNPVSALVGFELFGRPAVLKLQGRVDLDRARRRAVTVDRLTSPPHLEQYFRGIAWQTADGLFVRLAGNQDSHVLRSMADANCLVVAPQGAGEIPPGSTVEILELGPIPTGPP